jgi:hypothetical protein
MRSRILAFSIIVIMLLAMFAMMFPGAASADTWNPSISGGFTGNFQPAQPVVSSMAFFNTGSGDTLYVGTQNDSTGCRVYRFGGGTSWTQVNADGFGIATNTKASSMVSSNGYLYVGTRNTAGGCQVWRYDGSNWTRAGLLGGFGDANNVEASALTAFGGSVYTGTENDAAQSGNGCEVWRFSGIIWTQVNTNGFGFSNNLRVSSMTTFNGSLIAGTENTGTGCQVWQYNGSTWGAVLTNGFGNTANTAATAMLQYNYGLGNHLFVGTHNNDNTGGPQGSQLWEIYGAWGSPTITQIMSGGFGVWSNHSISSMAVYNDLGNKLFMGTSSDWSGGDGCQAWTYDGSTTAQVGTSGFGDSLNQGAVCAAAGNGSLFFGTFNDPNSNDTDRGTGAEVWQYNSGGPWTQINQNGFTTSNNYMVSSMVRTGNDIYAGTASATGCQVWMYNGDWNLLNNNGFGDQNNSVASSMAFYEDGGVQKLFVGTYNPAGCQLWRFDGPGRGDWTRVSSPADIEGSFNRSIASMAVCPGATPNVLYCGTYNNHGGCEVWSYNGTWTKMVGSGAAVPAGFGYSNNARATSAITVGNCVYFGVLHWGPEGCQVWRLTPTPPVTWEQSDMTGFGNGNNQDVLSMSVYGGMLYAGTLNWNNGCGVYRHNVSVLTGWEQVNDNGFDPANQESKATSMCAGQNKLYVGTAYNCQVWGSYSADTPASWSQANTNSFLTPGNQQVTAMVTRSEGLGTTTYAGTLNTDYGAEIQATQPSIDNVTPPTGVQGQTIDITIDGSNTNFGPTSTLSFNPSDGITVNSATPNGPNQMNANITLSDLAGVGPRSVNVLTPGETPQALTAGFIVLAPGVPSIAQVAPKGASQGKHLTVNILGSATHFVNGTSRATFSGSGITVHSTTVTDVHHATADVTVSPGAAVGSRNVNVVTGTEIPGPATNAFTVTYGPRQAWYLAEGCTANGFETWVLVQNPGPGGANVSLTYMTPSGAVAGPTAQLPPNTRKTFNVADTVANQTDVSTRVTADAPVLAERSMYGSNRGWADDSIGTWTPSKTWYLAEGCTGAGFDTWVLVQNPSAQQADVTLTFMTPTGAVPGPTVTMASNTRKSFKVNNTCPGEWQVSTKVTATQPVVAERSIYGNNGAWATESIGAAHAATQWYLPEGSTGPGFETWVLVQNPGTTEANVQLTLMEPGGKVAGPKLKIPANSRATVNLADTAPGQWSLSTMVTSDQPVVAERAMYGNNRQWAHDSIGATAPDTTWCLPEGSTGPGFETWVLVQNPGDTEAKINITYMTPDSDRTGPSVTLAAHSRQTFNVASSVPNVWEVSTKVTSDKPVIAERAMYGNSRIWGHDSIGCPR